MPKYKECKIEGVSVNLSAKEGPYSLVTKKGVSWFETPEVIEARRASWESYGVNWTVVVPKEFI